MTASNELFRQESNQRSVNTPNPSLSDTDASRSSIVQSAKTVLEDELQNRPTQNSDHPPSGLFGSQMDLESTLDLLLRQEENFLDTFLKVLKNRPEQLTQMATQLAQMAQPIAGNDFQPFPLLQVSSPVNAGNVGQILFSLMNDSQGETADYALHTTDLVGMDGHRIPATNINVSPNTSKIRPGESVDGQIEIRVPRGTPPGIYAGLLKTEEINRLMAIIQLAVAPFGSCPGYQVPNLSESQKLLHSSRIEDKTNTLTSQLGQEVEELPEALKPSRFQVNTEFLARVTITIESQRIIGPTPEGIRVTWNAKKGRVTGPRLLANLLQGADWMRIRPDGIGNLDVRAILETDDGAKIMTVYTGVLEWGEDGYQRFLAENFPKPLKAWTTQRFLTADSRYTWLNRLQCIGIGEVLLDEQTYTYDAYALR